MRVNEPITDREIDVEAERPLVSKTAAGGRITFVNEAFVNISGFIVKATINNISREGVAFEVEENIGHPTTLEIGIDGVGTRLSFNVIASSEPYFRGSFARAAVSRTRLPQVLEELRRRGGYKAA